MNDLLVEYLVPGQLIPYANNARKHSIEQMRQFERSIREFGFLTAILVDDQNRVVAGHGRLEAAKNLNLPRVPVLRVKHLSEPQLRAYRLADNKIAENATWDDGLLRVELDFLMNPDLNFDVDLTGFSSPAIDLLLGADQEIPDEPPLPELLDTALAVSREGDIWQLGHPSGGMRGQPGPCALGSPHGRRESDHGLYRPAVQRIDRRHGQWARQALSR